MNSADQAVRWTPQDVETAMQQVLSRARADASFRELCLKDSGAAVREAIHRDVPAGFRLRFVDNARANLTVVLPDMGKPEQELSDEDLEVVAGGNSKPSSPQSSPALPDLDVSNPEALRRNRNER